jgi:putative endonuclease
MENSRKRAERRGHKSESLAALWLRLKGYRILARRLKTHAGEIDLVKARAAVLAAAESVGPGQQTRIARAASLYLASRPGLARRGTRFYIVAIAPNSLPVHHRDVWRPDF